MGKKLGVMYEFASMIEEIMKREGIRKSLEIGLSVGDGNGRIRSSGMRKLYCYARHRYILVEMDYNLKVDREMEKVSNEVLVVGIGCVRDTLRNRLMELDEYSGGYR